MNDATQFLIDHGTPILFGVVLIEQAGLPLPAMPWLLAAGALAAAGKLDLVAVVAVTVLACLIADSTWFFIGRRDGKRVLARLCRISLESSRCVRRSERFFSDHAARGLLVAKFLGWLGMVIPPLAGATGMSYRRFLLFDSVGSVLYSSCGTVLGFVFSDQLRQGVAWLRRLGVGASVLALVLIAGYVVFKVIKRRRASSARPTKESGWERLPAPSLPKADPAGRVYASLAEAAHGTGVMRERGVRETSCVNAGCVLVEPLGVSVSAFAQPGALITAVRPDTGEPERAHGFFARLLGLRVVESARRKGGL